MSTRLPRRAAACLVLLVVLLCQDGRAQILIPVTVTDPEGHASAVQFGFDDSATACIDTALGEFELPPGGCADPYVCAALRNVRDDAAGCLGEGVLLDIRPYGSPADTFRLALVAAGGRVTLRWRIPEGARFDSLRLTDRFGGAVLGADMLATDSAEVDLALAPEMYIVAAGALQPAAAGEAPAGVPAASGLIGNYPNPFNPATTVAYRLDRRGPVRLAVYDLLGREVALLADGVGEAGDHEVRWDAAALPSGWYACRLSTAAGAAGARMMMLVR